MTAFPRCGVLALLVGTLIGIAPVARAQAPAFNAASTPDTELARAGGAGIRGIVLDDSGQPLSGAMVSALGVTSAFAVTDTAGAFRMRALPPGAYLVRAHLGGYAPSRGHIVQVTSTSPAVANLALHRTGVRAVGTSGQTPPDIVAAGLDGRAAGERVDDHSETAWRLRHVNRSVLKEATEHVTRIASDEPPSEGDFLPAVALLGRALESSAHLATSLFGSFESVPFKGQVNLLTTTVFDRPEDLLGTDALLRNNVAYVSLGASAGAHGDWAVRSALTPGDLSSWIIAGTYRKRHPARHAYELGMTYAVQRFLGGNPAAPASLRDGSRTAGSVYGSDLWTVNRYLAVSFGARYARYGYLTGAPLFSPRAQITVTPMRRVRVSTIVSREMVAPGAEEFDPPLVSDMWLPPERTFATVTASSPFRPQRTRHFEVQGEHDLGNGSAVIGVRAFRQRVDDQIVTLFGVHMIDKPRGDLGHYYVGNAGGFEAAGWGVTLSHAPSAHVRGSMAYTNAVATWYPSSQSISVVRIAPSAGRRDVERVHDLLASVETAIPATATRLAAFCRLNNAFARSDSVDGDPGSAVRFDLQVNQSLPFLNFSNAQWEMLVAVRSLFHDSALDASLYDELLVVRPPKRIVGGLLVRF
jgi:Carboxypeptidase regulatory-like domain/TonB dependent receptor-like, beta-barrel